MVNRLWRLWRRHGSSSWFRPRSLDSCGAGFNPVIAQHCVDAGSGSLGCAQLFWNSTRRQRRPCVSDETRGPLILGKQLLSCEQNKSLPLLNTGWISVCLRDPRQVMGIRKCHQHYLMVASTRRRICVD